MRVWSLAVAQNPDSNAHAIVPLSFPALSCLPPRHSPPRRFPFYYSFKCAFIVWLMLPSTRGAEVIYQKAIRPAFHNANQKVAEATSTAPTSASHST